MSDLSMSLPLPRRLDRGDAKTLSLAALQRQGHGQIGHRAPFMRERFSPSGDR